MFRYSIREMIMLTIVCGLSIGWCVDHFILSTKLETTKRWRPAAAAPELVLHRLRWKTEWDLKAGVFRASGVDGYHTVSTTSHEPSQCVSADE
jgi:hypothetical protein